MGGHDDDVVAFSEAGEYRDLQKHARAMEQEHLRSSSRTRSSRPCRWRPHTAASSWTGRGRRSPRNDGQAAELARTMDVPAKIKQMQNGERINTSERRAVLHTALRAQRGDAHPRRLRERRALHVDVGRGRPIDDAIKVDVRDRLLAFVDDVRNGRVRSVRGEPFESVVVVGIGGSYLGPEFVTQATAGEEDGRRVDVRFVANVDPVAFDVAAEGLDATKTLPSSCPSPGRRRRRCATPRRCR